MKIVSTFSKKAKDALIILGVGLFVGFLYPALHKEDNMGSVINGLIIGLTGSGFIVFNEIIFNPKNLRLVKFKIVVLYKTFIYTTFLF